MIAVPGPSAFTRAMILTTLTLVTTLYAMTVTIANVSLPQMQGTLSATTDQIALVVTFNIIATAIATPMTGWLAARFSRRAILIWGVIGFTCASLACGLATSLEGLVLFRVRSEEHTSELQSLMRISYAVFCL